MNQNRTETQRIFRANCERGQRSPLTRSSGKLTPQPALSLDPGVYGHELLFLDRTKGKSLTVNANRNMQVNR